MVMGGICCGMIADKWQCHRTVITLICLISLAAITTQPAVSVYYGNPETNKCPSPIIEETQSTYVSINSTLKDIACINSTDLHSNCTTNTNSNLNDKSYDNQNLYIIMFLINFFFAFSEGAGMSFIDSSALRRVQLSTSDRPVVFGRQRMFSAIGAIFGILVTNLSVDFFPENKKITCYTGIFVAYGIYTLLYGVSTILSYRGLSFQDDGEEEKDKEIGNINYAESDSENWNSSIPNESGEISPEVESTEEVKKTTDQNKNNKPKNANFRKIFFKTLFQFDILFFYLTTFISGLEYSQFTSFLFVYLKEMGASSIVLTLSIIMPGLMSAICFAHSLIIIKLLGGKWRTMMFCFFMYFVRYFGISLIRNPWLVLIFQPLHGVTATLYVATGLKHLKETSPLPVLTSLVSIFNSIHFGLGTFIGSSISGVIYQRYGGRALFRNTALLSIGWFCVLAVYVFFKERRERKCAKNSTQTAKGIENETGIES